MKIVLMSFLVLILMGGIAFADNGGNANSKGPKDLELEDTDPNSESDVKEFFVEEEEAADDVTNAEEKVDADEEHDDSVLEEIGLDANGVPFEEIVESYIEEELVFEEENKKNKK